MEGGQLLEEGITPFASFCSGEFLSSVREAILVSPQDLGLLVEKIL